MRNRYTKIAFDALLSLSFLALVLINMIAMPTCAFLTVHALSAGNHLAALVAFGIGWACATLLLIVADLSRLRQMPNCETATAPHPAAS